LRHWRRAAALCAGIVAGVASVARAQQAGVVTVGVDPAVSRLVEPGARLTVPIVVDPTGAPATNIASLTARVQWSPQRLTLDSIRPGAFGTLATSNTAGLAALSMFNPTATTTPTTIANLFFTAAATTSGARLDVTTTAAGNEGGGSILPLVRSLDADLCIAPVGMIGDATGDESIDIIDAQQIARLSVGLSVANASATSSFGDVNGDGAIDILDAQQVARFAVGFDDTSDRLGAPASLAPVVESVAIDAASSDVPVNRDVALLGVPQDANGVSLQGCTPLNWTTSDPAKALVSSSGVVTGVATGTATIRAAATNGKFATFDVDVYVPVGTVVLARDTATIHLGGQVQLSASVVDAANSVIGRRDRTADGPSVKSVSRDVTFTSTDPSIATVTSTGLVTGVMVGTAKITATSQGVSSVATIQVAPLVENSLALGDNFSCVLTVEGRPYCWGLNNANQLGDGTGVDRSTPVPVAMPSPDLRFTQIDAAGMGVCGVSTQRAAYCWGVVATLGSFVNPTVASAGLQVSSLDVAQSGACALDPSGTAYCVGDGTNGQLGNGGTASSPVPVKVSGGLTFQSISAGLFGSCGLSNGAGYCWGSNSFKTLGIAGDALLSLVPAPVTGGHVFAALATGGSATCGLDADGLAFCWGTDFNGNLGLGSFSGATNTPTPLAGGIKFAAIRPAVANDILAVSCGVDVGGAAYCWGANNNGQIGTAGDLPDTCQGVGLSVPCTAVPTPVSTSATFQTLRVGGEHACGITTDHTVLCWGKNASGQVGDGTTSHRGTPALVLGGLRIP
jgi:alpha-tubulin suppressor-like RCC1 family protein